MNTRWTRTTLAVVDDAYDRDRASDGRSRFGAYLRQKVRSLHGYDDAPLCAQEFAAAVWGIATAPVMSPGYVRTRPDLHAITPAWSEDGEGRLMFDVHVRLPCTQLRLDRAAVPVGWRDWQTVSNSESEGNYRCRVEPDGTRPALLTTTVIRLPVDGTWDLPAPGSTEGAGLVADAKRSVAAVATAVNHLAGPVVDRLRGEQP